MERRGEPRFPVSSPVRVVLPREGRSIEATLIDISATGMRLLTNEPVTESMVAIEVHSRLILAEIRHCEPRGDRFTLGTRRLHEIATDIPLDDTPAVVSEMLKHLHRHIAARGSQDSETMVTNALEKIVERRENPQLAITPPLPAEPADNEVVALVPQLAESAQEVVAPSPFPEQAPQAEIFEPPVLQVEPIVEPSEVANTVSALAGDSKPTGLTIRKGWSPVFAVAAALVLAAVATTMFIQRRTDAKQTVAIQADTKPGIPHQTTAVAAEPTPEPAAPPEPVTHHVEIRMLDRSWISIAPDRVEAFRGQLKQGDVREFDFSSEAYIALTNAASAEIVVDGNSMSHLPRGEHVVSLTPSGMALLK